MTAAAATIIAAVAAVYDIQMTSPWLSVATCSVVTEAEEAVETAAEAVECLAVVVAAAMAANPWRWWRALAAAPEAVQEDTGAQRLVGTRGAAWSTSRRDDVA